MEARRDAWIETQTYKGALIVQKFLEKWSYTLPHYTGVCGHKCPHHFARDFEIDNRMIANMTGWLALPFEILVMILREASKENEKILGTTRVLCRYMHCISEDRCVRSKENRSNKTYISPGEVELVSKLTVLFKTIADDAPMYCTHGHTTYVESLWSQRTSYMSKRVHFWRYYSLRSTCSYIHRNLGNKYKILVMERLGLYISQKCKTFVQNKDKTNK